MADKAIRGISPILRDILKSSNVTKEIKALGGFRQISKDQRKFLKKKKKKSKHPMAKQ
jgi:hypothetical protein|tara:strand:+ start:56 stop:229 length:174 start_codon:yes stop_codon:yes gene_type:complete